MLLHMHSKEILSMLADGKGLTGRVLTGRAGSN